MLDDSEEEESIVLVRCSELRCCSISTSCASRLRFILDAPCTCAECRNVPRERVESVVESARSRTARWPKESVAWVRGGCDNGRAVEMGALARDVGRGRLNCS